MWITFLEILLLWFHIFMIENELFMKFLET